MGTIKQLTDMMDWNINRDGEVPVAISLLKETLCITDDHMLDVHVKSFAANNGYEVFDSATIGNILFKKKSDMIMIDKCFECGEPVFIASYHLEPGKEYPSKYPVMFCDDRCRAIFLRTMIEVVAYEL